MAGREDSGAIKGGGWMKFPKGKISERFNYAPGNRFLSHVKT